MHITLPVSDLYVVLKASDQSLLPLLQNNFQRRDTTSSRSSSMELPDDIPQRAPPRHSTDMRHSTSSRHSNDLGRAHSVRPPGATAGQQSQLARGSTSQSDNSSWDNVSEENKGIIRQVRSKHSVQLSVIVCRKPTGIMSCISCCTPVHVVCLVLHAAQGLCVPGLHCTTSLSVVGLHSRDFKASLQSKCVQLAYNKGIQVIGPIRHARAHRFVPLMQ